MKKFLFIVFMLNLSIFTHAQKGMNFEIIANPGMSMGGKLSYNFSFLPFPIEMNRTYTFGYNTGIAASYNFNKNSGILFGILYSKQGQYYEANWYETSLKAFANREISLNYLKVPIQFNYLFYPVKKFTFSISAGVYFGVLLGFKDEVNSNFITPFQNFVYTSTATNEKYIGTIDDGFGTYQSYYNFLTKPFNTHDFGGTVVVGMEYKLCDKISIPFSLNYQTGFINIKNYDSQCIEPRYKMVFSYWGDDKSDNPNNLPFRNTLLGIETGLIIHI